MVFLFRPLLTKASRDVQTYLDNPSIRVLLGVDKHVPNVSIIAWDVYRRFWSTGDPMILTQPYVVELLARGVKVRRDARIKTYD